jgi:hypothetical protein
MTPTDIAKALRIGRASIYRTLGAPAQLTTIALSAHNGRFRMGSKFACPHCGAPSVVYPDEGEDSVVCAGCGAFLATRSQFRRLIERWERHFEIRTSGC